MDFSSLGTTEWLVIAGVILLLVIVLIVVLATRRRRRNTLSQRYGPEYERTVKAAGGERAARHDLSEREREREDLRLRDLDDRQRRDFGQRMARLQYRFAEDPSGAVYEAGRVAADALQARGYPITQDRDHALGLLAVDHPKEAQPLRTAIEGTYGKDQGRLRETFVGVRDSLREVLGVHYGLEDGGGGRDRSASGTGGAKTPGSGTATAGAVGAAADSRSRSSEESGDTGTGDTGSRDHGTRDTGSRDRSGGDTPGATSADRTVRLDDESDGSSRPVGAVPPAPSSSDTGRSGRS